MPSHEDERNLWTAMLDAEMNERYWDSMARRYGRIERGAKIAIAIISSGTAASLIFSLGKDWMWKVAAGIAAAGNVAMTILDHRTAIEKMAAMRQTWGELRVEYQARWAKRRVFTDVDYQDFYEFRKKEQARTVEESKLPKSEKLLRRAQADVLKANGLARN